MHPVLEQLHTRHTVKAYDPNKRISSDELTVILESLRLSASSINSQPWRFVVIESEAARQRFHDCFQTQHFYNQKHAFEASQIILLAHKTHYSRGDYALVVDQQIDDGRGEPGDREGMMGAYMFAEGETDESGFNGNWTRAQTYIALGFAMSACAQLGIGSTPIEGIEVDLVNAEFAKELDGHYCSVALAIGYSDPARDANAKKPKSRLPVDQVVFRI